MTGRLLCLCALACAILGAAPAAAAITSGPATRDAYIVWTIGDSYAAGEGAPDVNGHYNDNGDVQDGQFEDWDTRFGAGLTQEGPNQESTRCHRSGHTSTSAIATQALQDEFPDVRVDWKSVACSGASIVKLGQFKPIAPAKNKGGVLTRYTGVDSMSKRGISGADLRPTLYPPQIQQINNRFNGNIDALVMNVGGNDTGFGDIVSQCLNITNFGNCNEDEDLEDFVGTRIAALAGLLDRLDSALHGTATVTGDAVLNQAYPRAVYLTAAPNPLRETDAPNAFCNGTPKGGPEENLTAAESAWLEDTVLIPLNKRFGDEAEDHDWKFVNAHVNAFIGHAICSPSPANWINTNIEALRFQGELDETQGIPIAISGGIAHPNRDGYEATGAALRDVMRPVLLDQYTPDTAPVMTVPSRADGFTASLNDSALEAISGGYWHRIRLQRLDSTGNTVSLPNAPNGLRDLPYGTNSSNYALTGRFFVTARACGPLSRNGAMGCSPPTATLPVSTFVPATPVQLSAQGAAPEGLALPSPGITVKWKHKDQFARHDTRVTVVRLTSGRQVKVVNVPGPNTSTRVLGLTQGANYTITVSACNDGNRCSVSASTTARADQGESPLARESELSLIETAIAGVPCSETPVRFDPTVTGEDPTPDFRPGCTAEPSVGVLRLRPHVIRTRRGRAAQVALTWTSPIQWRALHEVAVRLVGRRGVLATVRFDQDDERVTLARGTRARGRSLKVGRKGRLRARGVRVRLGRQALVGSGPAGRDIALRFGVLLPKRAGRRVGQMVGASDDTGRRQVPVPAGSIVVR